MTSNNRSASRSSRVPAREVIRPPSNPSATPRRRPRDSNPSCGNARLFGEQCGMALCNLDSYREHFGRVDIERFAGSALQPGWVSGNGDAAHELNLAVNARKTRYPDEPMGFPGYRIGRICRLDPTLSELANDHHHGQVGPVYWLVCSGGSDCGSVRSTRSESGHTSATRTSGYGPPYGLIRLAPTTTSHPFSTS